MWKHLRLSLFTIVLSLFALKSMANNVVDQPHDYTKLINRLNILSEQKEYQSLLAKIDQSNLQLLDDNEGKVRILEIKSRALFMVGNYVDQVVVNKRIYELYSALHGPTHERTVSAIINYASSLDRLGKHDESLKIFKQVEGHSDNNPGEKNFNALIAKIWIGLTYYKMSEYSKAESYMRETIDDLNAANLEGIDRGMIGLAYMNLANLYFSLNDFDSAFKFSSKGFDENRKALGLNNPNTAVSLHQLARLWYLVDEPERALEFQLWALDVLIEFFGFEHPSTQDLMLRISRTYILMNDLQEALKYTHYVYAMQEKSGSSINTLVYSLELLSEISIRNGDYEIGLDPVFQYHRQF